MTITLFQIFLIIAIIFIFIFVRNSNIRSFYRIFIFFALIAGIITVIFPELTSIVASFIGIGRGTDLVFYIFIIVVFLKMLTTDDTVNSQQAQITKLVRSIAIQNATKSEKKADQN